MTSQLIDRLPTVRGRYTPGALLSKSTWFQVGGAVDVLFKPKDLEDLKSFLREKPEDIPVTVIGVGSNLLVRDGGVDGVVIRLGRAFAGIHMEEGVIVAGAGALDRNVAFVAQEQGMTGLEFLVGIPGTIGGAVRMNAGAYGTEIKDILIDATILDYKGNERTLTCEELEFSYRHSGLSEDMIVISARFKGKQGDPVLIAQRMDQIMEEREGSQPVRSRTGGSTFANPEGHKAWQLIDEAGFRGHTLGGAQVSDKHCNFLINTGEAKASDLETLGEQIRKAVKEQKGIELRWEIKRVGRESPKEEEEKA